VTHFSRLTSPTAAVGVRAANCGSLFRLLLFRAACFSFCGSVLGNYNSSFGSEQLGSAAVVRSSLCQLLWIRQLQLLEVGEASCSGARQLCKPQQLGVSPCRSRHPGPLAGLLRTWQQQLKAQRCQQQLLSSGASSQMKLGGRAEHVNKHLKQKAMYSQVFRLIATVNKMI
jgi:hypothetical protein